MDILARSAVVSRVKGALAPELKPLGFAPVRTTLPGWAWVAPNGADAIGVWFQVTTFERAFYLPRLDGIPTQPLAVRVEVGSTRRGDDMYELAVARGDSSLAPQVQTAVRREWELRAAATASEVWADLAGGVHPDELDSIRLGTSGDAPFFPVPTVAAADLWAQLVAPVVVAVARSRRNSLTSRR